MHGVRRKRQRVALLFLFRSNYQAYQWTGSIFSLYRLRDDKQKLQLESAGRDEQKKRIADMSTFLREQPTALTEYDEPLVRRLIEKVTIIYEDKFTVEFKSGGRWMNKGKNEQGTLRKLQRRVSLLFKLKNIAGISVFSCFALSFRFMSSISIPLFAVKAAHFHNNIQPDHTTSENPKNIKIDHSLTTDI